MNKSLEAANSSRPESLLKNRNFLLLFIGKFISMMGDQIYIFSLGWYILSVTKSSVKMGLLLAIGLLPAVVIGPFAGVIADRFDRKKIMVWMDFLRFGIVLFMAVMLKQGLMHLWVLYLGTALLEICGAIFNPSASAIIPNIVEENQYAQAASMDQLIWSTCVVVGMLTGGILFGLLGITVVFIINAISFLLSGMLAFNMKVPKRIRNEGKELNKLNELNALNEKSSVFSEMAYGFRFLKSNRGLFAVFIYFAFFNFFLYPIGNIYIPYVFNVLLKASPFQLAVVQASVFGGIIIGAVVMPKFLGKSTFKNALVKSTIVVGLVELLGAAVLSPLSTKSLSVWTIVILFLGLSTVLGMSMTAINIQVSVIFQKKVSDDVRGKVSSLTSAIVSAVIPVSYLAAGFIATRIPLYIVMGSTSLLLFLSIAVLSRIKAVGEM